jgi:arylsulfatase A-like enzyme
VSEKGWAAATVALLLVAGLGLAASRHHRTSRRPYVPQPIAPSMVDVPPPESSAKNLLMIVIDTQRTDVLGMYGSELGASPHMDRFAAEGVVFETAWAQGAYTMASFMSYMTSTQVRTHGLDGNLNSSGICAWDDVTTLPEALSEEGFATTAWVANSNLYPKKGFPRGFESWNGLDHDDMGKPLSKSDYVVGDVRVAKQGKSNIAQWRDDERNFLYLHLMAPHLPLDPSKKARQRFNLEADGPTLSLKKIYELRHKATKKQKQWTHDMYVASTWDGDRAVKFILDALREAGHDDDTVVVLMSDHGEEIWEHGDYGHQDGVWEQLVHVPLVVRAPGLQPARVARPVALMDVAPTMLAMLGVSETPDSWRGHSLWTPRPDPIFAQRFNEMAVTANGQLKAAWEWTEEEERAAEKELWADPASRRAMRKRPANLADGWNYFDLSRDPSEQSIIEVDEHTPSLPDYYRDFLAAAPPAPLRAEDAPVGICGLLSADEEEAHLQELKALGYVDSED